MPTAIEMAEWLLTISVLRNPFIPKHVRPTLKQQQFLISLEDEVLYGGAAGGGKSIALLAAALQFVMMPQYDALLLRRSFSDLTQPKALIPLSFDWLGNTDADWSEREHRWSFPSGATLTFGHMNSEKDKFNYQGAAYNFIGFDELTQFTYTMYTYLFSRLRRSIGTNIPGRMRAASNPGGDGHDWVKSRFLSHAPEVPFEEYDDETKEFSSRIFIPAKLSENPHLDQKDYMRKLGMMDPVTRAQLLRGDWDILAEGNMFKRAWFKTVDALPLDIDQTIRAWDIAATPPSSGNPDPDWTCGALLSRTRARRFIVRDIVRLRGNPAEVQQLICQTADRDGRDVAIRIEQEPGAAGKTVVFNFAHQLLTGFDVRASMPTGKKEVRAGPLSAACCREAVDILRGSWNSWWLDNIVGFPGLKHDDLVDAPAHAFNALTESLSIDMPMGDVGSYATSALGA